MRALIQVCVGVGIAKILSLLNFQLLVFEFTIVHCVDRSAIVNGCRIIYENFALLVTLNMSWHVIMLWHFDRSWNIEKLFLAQMHLVDGLLGRWRLRSLRFSHISPLVNLSLRVDTPAIAALSLMAIVILWWVP